MDIRPLSFPKPEAESAAPPARDAAASPKSFRKSLAGRGAAQARPRPAAGDEAALTLAGPALKPAEPALTLAELSYSLDGWLVAGEASMHSPQTLAIRRLIGEHLLPTVGDAITPALFRLLETVGQPEIQGGHIVSGLAQLSVAAVAPGAMRLLSSEDGRLRRNALALLARRPSAEALETLWRRYIELLQKNDMPRNGDEDQRETLWERLSVWPALEACVPLDPLWLEEKVGADPPVRGEPAGSLTALLCLAPDGRARWERLKETLRRNVPGGGERHFATAAYHWRDRDEVEWLQARVAVEDDMLGACCLRALTRIAPQAALASLGDLPPDELSSTRKWTVNLLWACRPQETVERLHELMQERADALWDYARALDDLPNAVDEPIFELLLDALLPRMAQESAEALRSELRRVAGASHLTLLKCLQRRAGTDWEARLTRLLVEEDPHPQAGATPFKKMPSGHCTRRAGRATRGWSTTGWRTGTCTPAGKALMRLSSAPTRKRSGCSKRWPPRDITRDVKMKRTMTPPAHRWLSPASAPGAP